MKWCLLLQYNFTDSPLPICTEAAVVACSEDHFYEFILLNVSPVFSFYINNYPT